MAFLPRTGSSLLAGFRKMLSSYFSPLQHGISLPCTILLFFLVDFVVFLGGVLMLPSVTVGTVDVSTFFVLFASCQKFN